MAPDLRHPCIRHPETEGGRRCFQCKRYFCKSCYFVRDRHVFCSEECYSKFLNGRSAEKETQKTEAPENQDAPASSPFREIPTPAPELPIPVSSKTPIVYRIGGAAVLLIMAGLITGLALLWDSYSELSRSYYELRTEQNKLRRMTEGLLGKPGHKSAHPIRPLIDSPFSGSSLRGRFIDVKGRYPENRVLLLVVNGTKFDTVTAGRGKFVFRSVPLRPGKNILSVKALFGKRAVSSDSIEVTALQGSGQRSRFSSELPDYSFDRGSLHKPFLSLTFDCDSYANAALEILEILRGRGVKATFFLTGNFIRKYPNFVKLIFAEGHEIANHTNRHPHLTSFYLTASQTTLPDMTAEKLAQELQGADAAFAQVTGRSMSPYWRAPYGDYNQTLCAWARAAGYTHVGWTSYGSWLTNMDTNDWIPNPQTAGYKSPQEVVEKILHFGEGTPHGANGGIILMHLGTTRRDISQQVHRSLERIIDGMRAKGYSFVTIGEMMENKTKDQPIAKP